MRDRTQLDLPPSPSPAPIPRQNTAGPSWLATLTSLPPPSLLFYLFFHPILFFPSCQHSHGLSGAIRRHNFLPAAERQFSLRAFHQRLTVSCDVEGGYVGGGRKGTMGERGDKEVGKERDEDVKKGPRKAVSTCARKLNVRRLLLRQQGLLVQTAMAPRSPAHPSTTHTRPQPHTHKPLSLRNTVNEFCFKGDGVAARRQRTRFPRET